MMMEQINCASHKLLRACKKVDENKPARSADPCSKLWTPYLQIASRCSSRWVGARTESWLASRLVRTQTTQERRLEQKDRAIVPVEQLA